MNRKPPDSVKRQLRQEAGFGCCLCGTPIIQYHHIKEWAEENHFRPHDMMVLCPLHHDQATKGALPEAEQRKFKAEPHNIKQGRAKGLLAVKQNYCALQLGAVEIVGDGPFLTMDGETIVALEVEDGVLQVSLRLFSESDEPLMEIVKNEWISGNPLPWDVESDWQKLTVRERSRKISLSLDARSIPMELNADLWRGGQQVRFDKDGVWINTKCTKLGVKHLALVGAWINIQHGSVTIGPAPPSLETLVISEANRSLRLRKARDAWSALKRKANHNAPR